MAACDALTRPIPRPPRSPLLSPRSTIRRTMTNKRTTGFLVGKTRTPPTYLSGPDKRSFAAAHLEKVWSASRIQLCIQPILSVTERVLSLRLRGDRPQALLSNYRRLAAATAKMTLTAHTDSRKTRRIHTVE